MFSKKVEGIQLKNGRNMQKQSSEVAVLIAALVVGRIQSLSFKASKITIRNPGDGKSEGITKDAE